jgi:hypothetical protein
MLNKLKGLLSSWWWGVPAVAPQGAIPADRPDHVVALEKAFATLAPTARGTYEHVLRIAQQSGDWDRYMSTLVEIIERLSDDHQIVVMHHLVRQHMPVVATFAFARWARNNGRHIAEIERDGGIGLKEFFARVAAA